MNKWDIFLIGLVIGWMLRAFFAWRDSRKVGKAIREVRDRLEKMRETSMQHSK